MGRVESRCAPLELGGDRGGARGKAGTREGGVRYRGVSGACVLAGVGWLGVGRVARGRKEPRPPMTLPEGNGLLVCL